VRFVATTRWCDFEVFGPDEIDRSMRAGAYYLRLMATTLGGAPFLAAEVRAEALACRAWLGTELAQGEVGLDATVAITHFAPSLRSADPRYGRQPGTASFCNADDDLLPWADLWIHGHLHCRHDYRAVHPDGSSTRVVCNARGHARKGEAQGFDPLRVFDVFGA